MRTGWEEAFPSTLVAYDDILVYWDITHTHTHNQDTTLVYEDHTGLTGHYPYTNIYTQNQDKTLVCEDHTGLTGYHQYTHNQGKTPWL